MAKNVNLKNGISAQMEEMKKNEANRKVVENTPKTTVEAPNSASNEKIEETTVNVSNEPEKANNEEMSGYTKLINKTAKEIKSKRINFMVKPSSHQAFKEACSLAGTSMNDVIDNFMRDFAKEVLGDK